MRISELIACLQQEAQKHGDMEVVLRLETGYCIPIQSLVEYHHGSFGGRCVMVSSSEEPV